MKKILALAMALCMMLAVVPFVFAEDEPCDCGNPDCTVVCECDAATCGGDCCAAAEEETDSVNFFQMIIEFLTNKIFNEIQRLINRIVEAIGGPSLPGLFS